MVVVNEKAIGYRISITKSEKNHLAEMEVESEGESFQRGESQLDGGVL